MNARCPYCRSTEVEDCDCGAGAYTSPHFTCRSCRRAWNATDGIYEFGPMRMTPSRQAIVDAAKREARSKREAEVSDG